MMAFPKIPLVSLLHLLVLHVCCVTVLANELDLLSQTLTQPPSQAPVKPPPVKPVPVKSQPQVPVKPQPPIKPEPPVKPQPPSQAPIKPQPPSQAPIKPQPPSQAPSYQVPKRKLVAVEGVVYCKPCEFSGVDTLISATPLAGATVKLQCNNTKHPQTQQARTDKNGYFFMMAPNTITNYGSHKCRVKLGSSPQPNCVKPSNLHYGLQGAILMPKKQPHLPKPLPYQIFTVGPFAFEPTTTCSP